MMRIILTLFATIFCWPAHCEAALCDDSIINTIREKFWNNGSCTPQNLFRWGAYSSPGITVRTSLDYYSGGDRLSCVNTVFDSSVVKLYMNYINSSMSVQVTLVNNVEEDGLIIFKDTGEYCYYLYVGRLGVTALYKCTKTGESGDPQGIIKGNARGYDKDALAQSVKDLESLGITLSDQSYDDSCLT